METGNRFPLFDLLKLQTSVMPFHGKSQGAQGYGTVAYRKKKPRMVIRGPWETWWCSIH
jgi:hypothetical protein